MRKLTFNTVRNFIMRRLRAIEYDASHPFEIQSNVLKNLLITAERTEWGKKYDFKSINSYEDFKTRLPLHDYVALKPEIDRMLKGESNIIWPESIKWFAKSSGTTAGNSKFIPVSNEAIENCHYKAGKDLLAMYLKLKPDTEIFRGYGLTLGGSHQFNRLNRDSYIGDLSAILMQNLPFWMKLWQQPSMKTSMMTDWEEKIEKMAREVVQKNITYISGVPTWTVVLINKLLESTGKKKLNHIFPNLELYVHGGVSFKPYKQLFSKMIPSEKMHYMETYNASEGFFAFQDQIDDPGLLLMLNHGIFYEFIPLSEIHKCKPEVFDLSGVSEDVNYAIVISTNSGLWRYVLGDTVTFVSLSPFRIRLTGRTRNFINAFGEELIIENAEQAISLACQASNCEIMDFTASPKYFSNKNNGAHEWLIEFKKEPEDFSYFCLELDKSLKELNSDYETKRYKDIALSPPLVHKLKEGTFYRWMKKKGKLGGQNKVPRLFNDRTYVDDIKSFAGIL